MKNNVEKIIENTIKKHGLLNEGDTVVLGLSGGPDSLCLFTVLMKLAGKMRLEIQPVHINHMMRPGAADEDQAFVEAICKAQGLECISVKIDCPAMAKEEGLTSEEAGRRARYDSFFNTAMELSQNGKEAGRVKIAVAQNANDQAETVLFRLLRGTGTDGLAGIAYERYEKRGDTSFKVIRPLLDVFRKDIEEYCKDKGLEPVVDHTNSQAIYSRNKIRLELLPLLEKEYNDNIKETLVRLSRIASADKDYIWQEVERAYDRILIEEKEGTDGRLASVTVDRAGLARLHDTIRHRVVFKAFGKIGLESDISAERLEAADKIICVKQGPKTVEFPRNYSLSVARGRVDFAYKE